MYLSPAKFRELSCIIMLFRCSSTLPALSPDISRSRRWDVSLEVRPIAPLNKQVLIRSRVKIGWLHSNWNHQSGFVFTKAQRQKVHVCRRCREPVSCGHKTKTDKKYEELQWTKREFRTSNFPGFAGATKVRMVLVSPRSDALMSCSSACSCSMETTQPVCAGDAMLFPTPCHAGCTSGFPNRVSALMSSTQVL